MMRISDTYTNSSSRFVAFFFFPSFFFCLKYLQRGIGLQFLHLAQCSLSFRSLLRVKHCSFPLRVSEFFLVHLFFNFCIVGRVLNSTIGLIDVFSISGRREMRFSSINSSTFLLSQNNLLWMPSELIG